MAQPDQESMMALLQSPPGGPAGQAAAAVVPEPFPVPAATDQLIDQLLEKVEVPAVGAPPTLPMPSDLSTSFPATNAVPAYPYPLLGAGAGSQLDPLVQELQQRRPLGSAMSGLPQPAGMPWPGFNAAAGAAMRLPGLMAAPNGGAWAPPGMQLPPGFQPGMLPTLPRGPARTQMDPKQFGRVGEPYMRHRHDLRDAAGQPSCTRSLPYCRPAQAKPRMPRRAAGALSPMMVDGDGTVANLMGPQAPGAAQRAFPGWYHAPGSTSAYQAAAAAGGWRRGAGNNRGRGGRGRSAEPVGRGRGRGRKRVWNSDDDEFSSEAPTSEEEEEADRPEYEGEPDEKMRKAKDDAGYDSEVEALKKMQERRTSTRAKRRKPEVQNAINAVVGAPFTTHAPADGAAGQVPQPVLAANGAMALPAAIALPTAQVKAEVKPEPVPEPVPVWVPPVLDRGLTAEQVEDAVEQLQQNWELAAIFDFLQVFRYNLNLQYSFTALELEEALAGATGDGGLLADLHMDLLRSMYPRIQVNQWNWPIYLADKLKLHWKETGNHKYSQVPFSIPRATDGSYHYSRLPADQRVTALKVLCELRLERADIRNRLEAAEIMRHNRRKAAEMRLGAPEEELPAFRRHPLGQDSQGFIYWYCDCWETTGPRLYRETPAASEMPYHKRAAKELRRLAEAEAARAAAALATAASADGNAGPAANGDKPTTAEAGDAAPVAAAAAVAASTGLEVGENAGAAQGVRPDASAAQRAPSANHGGGDNDTMIKPNVVYPETPFPEGSAMHEVPCGGWELVASFAEEVAAIAEPLRLSDHKRDQRLASALLDRIVPAMEDAPAELQRRAADILRRGGIATGSQPLPAAVTAAAAVSATADGGGGDGAEQTGEHSGAAAGGSDAADGTAADSGPGTKAGGGGAATADWHGGPAPAPGKKPAAAAADARDAGRPPTAPPTRAYEGPPMQKIKLKLRMKPVTAVAPPSAPQ